MFRPEQLPAELAKLLDQVAELPSAESFTAMDPATRASWLSGLRQLINRSEAHFIECLGAFDAHRDGDTLHGAASTAAWLRGALGLAHGDATERVRIARLSHEHMRETVCELSTGTLTYDHVRAIARSTRAMPDEHRGAAANLLTDLAKQCDVGSVRMAGRRLEFVANPDGTMADDDQQFQRRFLHMSPLLDGMTAVDGLLDPESAAVLSAALGPYLKPCGREDKRSTPQRRADALVDLARAQTAGANMPPLPVVASSTATSTTPSRPTLNILCSLETAKGGDGGDAGVDPGVVLGLPGLGLIAPSAVARLSCDSDVARVLLGPDKIPTEYGRRKRLFTSGQRHALAVRDRGCRFPDCPRPPAHTDAHNILPWQDGGGTDLTNAVLLPIPP